MEVPKYQHDLGGGIFLNAYSLDPKIDETALREMVVGKDAGRGSVANLEKLANDFQFVGEINSFGELKVEVSDKPYEVPEQLKPYRMALDEKLKAEGKFNGPVALLNGAFGSSLKLSPGGYFDFMATKLNVVPADLVPDKYPKGKTLKELMPELGITNEQRARYFALAFSMMPSDSEEFGLVQRAKGLGIAAGVMSLSGATPGFKKEFFEKGFNFKEYYEGIITQEMGEEYALNPGEFKLNGAYLIDGESTVPHAAVRIETHLSMKELAEKNYGRADAVSEHPVLYSVNPPGINNLLNRFIGAMEPSSAFMMHVVDKNRVA